MTVEVDGEQVVEALGAFATIPDWLAAPMQPDRVAASLCRHVVALDEGHVRLVRCIPDRLRAKEDGWFARYTLSLEWPDGRLSETVLIGQLFPPGVEWFAGAVGTNGPSIGEPGWTCVLPDLRLELRSQAADDALPSLPQLTDPPAVMRLLEEVLREAGRPGAVIETCRPVVVRYKPGSRCTVVVDVDYAGPRTGQTAPPTPVVLKTHEGTDKGQAAWAAMTALWERPDTWRDDVRLAEPLAYLPDRRILVQGPVPEERTLKDMARDAIATADPARLDLVREELVKTARGIAAIHRSGATYGRTATIDQELAEVTDVVQRLAFSVPELGAAAGQLVFALTARSEEIAPDPVVPAHHDFRPAQVLLHGGGIGFIDFDGACMAEPALDLGRFRAKLRDIGISTLVPFDAHKDADDVARTLMLLDDLCEHFLLAYQEHAPVSRGRVLLWEACDLFTTMLHAWTKVRVVRLEPRLATLVHHLRTTGVLS
jgi:hypothetical protein